MSSPKDTYRRFFEFCSLAPAVVVFLKFSLLYVLDRFSLKMFYRFQQVPYYAVSLYQTFFNKIDFYAQKEVHNRNPGTRTKLLQDQDIDRPEPRKIGKF